MPKATPPTMASTVCKRTIRMRCGGQPEDESMCKACRRWQKEAKRKEAKR